MSRTPSLSMNTKTPASAPDSAPHFPENGDFARPAAEVRFRPGPYARFRQDVHVVYSRRHIVDCGRSTWSIPGGHVMTFFLKIIASRTATRIYGRKYPPQGYVTTLCHSVSIKVTFDVNADNRANEQ